MSNPQRGFTLVELMVAVLLITVAMLMGGRFIVTQLQQVSLSESRAQAAEFATETAERVAQLPFDSIQSVAATPVPEAPAYLRSVDVRDVGGGPTDLYYYRVVTVTVTPPGKLPAVSVTTAVAP